MARFIKSWSHLFDMLDGRQDVEIIRPIVELENYAVGHKLIVGPRVEIGHDGYIKIVPPMLYINDRLTQMFEERSKSVIVKIGGLEFVKEDDSWWAKWVVNTPEVLKCLERGRGLKSVKDVWQELSWKLNRVVDCYSSCLSYRYFRTEEDDIRDIEAQLKRLKYDKFYHCKKTFYAWRAGMPVPHYESGRTMRSVKRHEVAEKLILVVAPKEIVVPCSDERN